MSKDINNNGYEYVDLRLPSGTLWSTMNVGADKPSDYGLYFQWGDIQGYNAEQIGLGDGQKRFANDFTDYKWHLSGDDFDNDNFTKYKTEGDVLELDDDAAHFHMGGSWHMPSSEQIQELINETTSNWMKLDGVNGKLFTSDNGKSIFIPAAGSAWDGSIGSSGSDGYVWSSMLGVNFIDGGQYLGFGPGYINIYNGGRYHGQSVRGVIG
jgi:hypothetical protein